MPTTLTPTEAQKLLTNLSPGAKLEISKTPEGEIVVSEASETKTKEDILKEQYAKLIGQPITVTDAAERYNVHRDTIIEWKKKDYITVLKPGYRMELDEAEVAYCADIYHKRQRKSGVPLLDDDGLPYQLKHPQLSEYRESKRKST
jgi:hypothetical protein